MATSPEELARLLGARKVPNTSLSTYGSNPLAARPQAAPRGGTPQVSDEMLQYAQAQAQGGGWTPPKPKGPDLPWYQDALAAVFDNPVGHVAMKALEPLQVGASWLGAAVKEGGDAFNASPIGEWMATTDLIPDSVMTRKSKAEWEKSTHGEGAVSWDQLVNNAQAKKTMGNYIEELNPNANHAYKVAFGATGDIAVDPLTYVTLGSTKAAGQAGRLANAAKLASEGGLAAKATELGVEVSDDLLKRVGKGSAWLNDAERELLGIEKSGIRVGLGHDGLRIPGTGGVARTVGKGTGMLRRGLMRPWHGIGLGEDGAKLAKAVLARGESINGMTLRGAATTLAYDANERLLRKSFAQPLLDAVNDPLMKLTDGEGHALTQAIERGTGGAQFAEVMANARQVADDAGLNIGTIAKDAEGKGINYMPHMTTDSGAEFLTGKTIEQNGRKFTYDATAESGRASTRTLTGGKAKIQGVVVDLGDGTIDEINAALEKAFPGVGKVFEDDAARLIPAYIDGLSRDVAQVGALKTLVANRADGGYALVEDLNHVSDGVLQRVKDATKSQELSDALGEYLTKRQADLVVERGQAREQAKLLQDGLAEVVKRRLDGLGEFGARLNQVISDGEKHGKNLADQAKQIGQTIAKRRADAERAIKDIDKELKKLDQKIAASRVREAAAAEPGKVIEAFNADILERTRLMGARVQHEKMVAETRAVAERLAEMVRATRALRDNVDDPDYIRALTQELAATLDDHELAAHLPSEADAALTGSLLGEAKPKAVKGEALKAVDNAAKLRHADVTDEMLATVPDVERQAFTDLRDRVTAVKKTNPTAVASAEREALKGKIAQINERLATLEDQTASSGVKDEAQREALRSEAAQLHAQVDAITARLEDKAAMGAAAAADEAKLDTMTEWIGRYNKALAAGEEPSADLAARVARGVVQSERENVRGALASAKGAVEAVSSKDAKKIAEASKTELGTRLAEITDVLVDDKDMRAKVKAFLNGKSGAEQTSAAVKQEVESAVNSIIGTLGLAPEQAGRGAYGWRARLALADSSPDAMRAAQAAAEEKATAILKRLVNKSIGQAKDPADLTKLVDELFVNMSEPQRMKLLGTLPDRVDALTAKLEQLDAAHAALGGGRKPITGSWQDIVFGVDPAANAQRMADGQAAQAIHDQARAAHQELTSWAKGAEKEISATRRGLGADEQAAARMAKELQVEPHAVKDVVAAREAATGAVSDVVQRRDVLLERRKAYVDSLPVDRARGMHELDRIDQSLKAIKEHVAQSKAAKRTVDARITRVGRAAEQLAKVNGDEDLMKVSRDLRAVYRQLGKDADVQPVAELLTTFTDSLTKMTATEKDIASTEKQIAQALKGADMQSALATEGWERIAENLLPEGQALAVAPDVAKALGHLHSSLVSGELGKVFSAFTQFFKTYATATPGFHVRNALSAAFMNASDGVSLSATREALGAWRSYMRDPIGFLAEVEKSNPMLHDAFKVAFGSGAGGQYSAEELTKSSSKLLHNRFTRFSKKMGERVEGSVRLAMALDSMQRGEDLMTALGRVTRIHFDYSQVSMLDQRVKQLVPFWTFMSRNLPLQVQQMAMRPAVYQAYGHFVENMGGAMEMAPDWLKPRLPVSLEPDKQPGETQWALAPDLPHLGLGEDMKSLLDISNPGAALSNLNPMLVALPQAIANRRWRFDSPIAKDGAVGGFGGRANYAATAMIPPWATAQRILGLGRYEGQSLEKIASFLGLPIQQISAAEQSAGR